MSKKAAQILPRDIEKARIPYLTEGPDGPLFADFSSLGHSSVAILDRSGATRKEAMQVAGHSDARLTKAVYGRVEFHELGEAVTRLPSLLERPRRFAQGWYKPVTPGETV